jgi:glycerol uptake facilitator protein
MHGLLRIGGPSDWAYAWVPIVGPLLGGSFAAALYLLLK